MNSICVYVCVNVRENSVNYHQSEINLHLNTSIYSFINISTHVFSTIKSSWFVSLIIRNDCFSFHWLNLQDQEGFYSSFCHKCILHTTDGPSLSCLSSLLLMLSGNISLLIPAVPYSSVAAFVKSNC